MIVQICYRHPNDVVKHVYKCLLDWKKRVAVDAYLDGINAVFQKENTKEMTFPVYTTLVFRMILIKYT